MVDFYLVYYVKKTLGTSAGSLAHIIFMECGHDIARKLDYHI